MWDKKLEDSAQACADSCRTVDEWHCPQQGEPGYEACKCTKPGGPGENFHGTRDVNKVMEWYVVRISCMEIMFMSVIYQVRE